MDYLKVALAADLTAFLITAILLLVLLVQSFIQRWKIILLIGVFGQFLWSAGKIYSYYQTEISGSVRQLYIYYDQEPIFLQSYFLSLNLEVLRFALWLICLFLLLSRRISFLHWPRKIKIVVLSDIFVTFFGFYAVNTSYFSADDIRLLFMMMAIASLIFSEQVIRNLNAHRMIKLFGLCVAFLLAYDVFMYGMYSTGTVLDIPSQVIQGRSALAFLMMTALTVGSLLFNVKQDNQSLFSVSRPAAFFSTAAILSTLLILIVCLGNYYLRYQGYLSSYLFILALIAALLLIFSLIISRSFRQHFEVFVSKHFFALKYDYRIEWLKAIRRVSDLKTDRPSYYYEVIDIIGSAVRSPSCSLWINSGSELSEKASTMILVNKPQTIPVHEAFVRIMLKESWIFAPQSDSSSLKGNNKLLPDWIAKNPDIWLVVPLVIQMKLVGFVLLSRPKLATDITYEDRDLITNISTQVASHLLLHQQEKVISDAKQLETYNRLSAFIMHDMNNIIAQLSLIGKNAERHKSNPAFVEDMIKTVQNATSRMQGLIQKFNPAIKENRTSFNVSEVIQEVLGEVKLSLPKPEFVVENDFMIEADKHRLCLAIKNIVRNAQEATDDSGWIRIRAIRSQFGFKLIVEDNGQGMSQQFISEELFRPFSTTKNEMGVGIGAYLTKSYLENLGALLTVVSKEGEGTRFEITFNNGE